MKLATLVLVGILVGALLYGAPQASVRLMAETPDFTIYLVALTTGTMVAFYLVFVGLSGMVVEALGSTEE